MQLVQRGEKVDRLVVYMVREADVDRPSVAMNEWILIDSDRIGSSALWMRCEGLALRRSLSATNSHLLEDAYLDKIGKQIPEAPSRIA